MKTTTQKFSTYSEYVNHWLKTNEIKIKSVYVQDGNYHPYFIYVNRIANCSNPKFRILQRGKDKVKNCLMITFNVDTVDKEYLSYLLHSKIYLLNFLSQGSCHRFLNKGILGEILSGAVNKNGQMNKDVLNQ